MNHQGTTPRLIPSDFLWFTLTALLFYTSSFKVFLIYAAWVPAAWILWFCIREVTISRYDMLVLAGWEIAGVLSAGALWSFQTYSEGVNYSVWKEAHLESPHFWLCVAVLLGSTAILIGRHIKLRSHTDQETSPWPNSSKLSKQMQASGIILAITSVLGHLFILVNLDRGRLSHQYFWIGVSKGAFLTFLLFFGMFVAWLVAYMRAGKANSKEAPE